MGRRRTKKHLKEQEMIIKYGENKYKEIKELKQYEEYEQMIQQSKQSQGPSVTMINSLGQMESYNNLNEMKQSQEENKNRHQNNFSIENVIQLRTNRNEIFKDSNPWTYTPQEALHLGLLPEIPKNYFEKQEE